MKVYIILIIPIMLINCAGSLSCFEGIEIYMGSKVLNGNVALNECSSTNASVCLSAFLTIPRTDHTVSFAVKRCFNGSDRGYLNCEYLLELLQNNIFFKSFLKNSSDVSKCNFSYCEKDGCNSTNVLNVTTAATFDTTQITTSLLAVDTNPAMITTWRSSTTSAGVREIIAYKEMLILVIAGYLYITAL